MNRTEREEYLYHNTEKLLEKYRDISWSIEVATMQCEEDFKKEMECSTLLIYFFVIQYV